MANVMQVWATVWEQQANFTIWWQNTHKKCSRQSQGSESNLATQHTEQSVVGNV